MKRNQTVTQTLFALCTLLIVTGPAASAAGDAAAPQDEARMLAVLDAPLLFTRRHSYSGIHIYDTYYKWPPGGGGIYVLENPSDPRDQWKIRPVIDPTTPETLGVGVYDEPELSWDATRLLFTFKGEPSGSTAVYEIGVDGRGLRRVSDPSGTCDCYKGSHAGQHDVCPAWLPDGRIVLLSTRPSGLVPCANSGVAILHVMNADGSDMHPISVNNVNDFDPAVLPDGRILFGRWEYVDKNALTIQSLWTINPDGTQETAFFANNMVFPEAILDARPVPESHLVVGTFAKHNSTPRGSIALVDPRLGKNGPEPIVNLEHPDDPTFDRGDSCEPWPVSRDIFLFSGRSAGDERNSIRLIDRRGRCVTVLADPDICLHSPMLIKPRPVPPVLPDVVDRNATTGRFFVQDIYRGLVGVERGEVKSLRVIEETSRVSPTLMAGSPYNQTFLVSAALAFSVKNFLGVVPVEDDGSAYFEVPAGRALYLQALDADGRLVQSMRTFVQAAPGTTRSCIGCHEYKYSTTGDTRSLPLPLDRQPRQLEPESWGSGYVDYTSMIQPVLDRRCARCHGGAEGFAGGIDLSGGWTEHFNISYENLANRRQTQLIAHWISGIDCMNGTALWSSQLFPPRGHGSGNAPLAELLVEGHDGQIADLSHSERDLLMAWIDTNGLYYGTWDATPAGCAIKHWKSTVAALVGRMQVAGCLECHGDGKNIAYFENDWINLRDPQMSRILRAPLAKGGEGFGEAMCRDRKIDPRQQRLHLLWQGYAHAVQPPEAFPKRETMPPDAEAAPVASFASPADPNYQAMLSILRDARQKALAQPRVDMPGAEVIPGACRMFVPPPVPEAAPAPVAEPDPEGVVHVSWERSARTIGLEAELHRASEPGFAPSKDTLLVRTTLSRYVDREPPAGKQHYALVLCGGECPTGECDVASEGEEGPLSAVACLPARSAPGYAAVDVPQPAPPPAPFGLEALPASSAVRLGWQAPKASLLGYHVERAGAGSTDFERITAEPVRATQFVDGSVEPEVAYTYVVRAVSRRNVAGEPSPPVEATATVIREPMFAIEADGKLRGRLFGGDVLPGKLHGPVKTEGGMFDLRGGGHVTFSNHAHFAPSQPLSLECWVWFDEPGSMPVIAGCGVWRQSGWFLQRIGAGFRWHLGGVDCDGGQSAVGRWIHLVGTFDGRAARLYQDGRLVAEKPGPFVTDGWPGELHVGQYSGGPGPQYQVVGRIAGVSIYHRALPDSEVAAAAETPPP